MFATTKPEAEHFIKITYIFISAFHVDWVRNLLSHMRS